MLTAADDVRMDYADIKDPENLRVGKAFEIQVGAIREVLKRKLNRHDPTAAPVKDDDELIIEERQDCSPQCSC